MVGARIVGDLVARTPSIPPWLGTAASYVVVWVPLVVAVVVA